MLCVTSWIYLENASVVWLRSVMALNNESVPCDISTTASRNASVLWLLSITASRNASVLWLISISNSKNAYYLLTANENLGRCYYGLRDYRSALDHFETYYKKYPNDLHASALLCEAKFYAWDALQSDEKPNAIVAFCGQVLQKDPDNKIAKKTINKLAASIKQKIDVLNDEGSKRLIEIEKNKKK